MQHIRVDGRHIALQTSVFKGKLNHLPEAYLSFSKLPKLNLVVAKWFHKRWKLDGKEGLVFPHSGSSAGAVNNLLARFKNIFGGEVPGTSHAFKRGCVSVLDALGYKQNLINSHVGWVVDSKMLSTYRRPVHITEVDKLFYSDILARQ